MKELNKYSSNILNLLPILGKLNEVMKQLSTLSTFSIFHKQLTSLGGRSSFLLTELYIIKLCVKSYWTSEKNIRWLLGNYMTETSDIYLLSFALV